MYSAKPGQGHEHARDVPELLGTTENELGIRPWLEEKGHTLVTTSDKEGENSKFDQELVDAEVIITTPSVPSFYKNALRRTMFDISHKTNVLT